MKKILVYCIVAVILLWWVGTSFWACEYNESWDVAGNIQNCLGDSELVNPWDGLVEWGVKQKFIFWTNSLATTLSIFAIGAIVYWGLLMTLSVGEDEKIKKGKDVVKWSILGFLWAIWAWALVRLVIEVVFAVAS